jgi:hypothetical protein
VWKRASNSTEKQKQNFNLIVYTKSTLPVAHVEDRPSEGKELEEILQADGARHAAARFTLLPSKDEKRFAAESENLRMFVVLFLHCSI